MMTAFEWLITATGLYVGFLMYRFYSGLTINPLGIDSPEWLIFTIIFPAFGLIVGWLLFIVI